MRLVVDGQLVLTFDEAYASRLRPGPFVARSTEHRCLGAQLRGVRSQLSRFHYHALIGLRAEHRRAAAAWQTPVVGRLVI